MKLTATDRRKGAARVRFENPLDVRVMAIDGTWCRDCQLIEVSETGAQISVIGPPVIDAEMILLLTRFGSPVFRMCMRTSVDGALMEVLFQRDVIGKKLFTQRGHEAELA
ncbi:MAG: hypothetical protein JWR89_1443 [Tardiphaga sp.]|nr:hypothetical protein [Tardiphaga sp.]